jgi:hypothetical protein
MDSSWNRVGWILVANRVGLILVAALVLLVIWAESKRSSDDSEQVKPNAGQVVEQAKPTAGQVASRLSVDGVDLKSSVQKALDGLKKTLQGVTDAASAKAALPQLEKEKTEFDRLRDLAGKLPADGKTAFVALIAQPRTSIEELFKKLLAIPGVNDIAKPIIDDLRQARCFKQSIN